MSLFSITLFVSAAATIVALLELKRHEETRGTRFFADRARTKLDMFAVGAKDYLSQSGSEFAKIPPTLLHYSRIGVHQAALATAALARFLEAQAYALADMVSHKHRFEHRETRSEFLIRMTEHKQGRARPHSF